MRLTLGETEFVRLGVEVADQEKDARAETDTERVGEIDAVPERLRDGLTVTEGDPDELLDLLGEAVPVLLTDRVLLGDPVADQLKEARADADLLTVPEVLPDDDLLREGDPVLVTDTVPERL